MKTTLFLIVLAVISSLTISNKGLELIKEFEKLKLKAEKGVTGKWTIGYGTTDADYRVTKTKIKSGLEIDAQKAETWLKKSLNKIYAPKVNKYNNKYHWTQNEFDAMVSFTYNTGKIDELTARGKRTKQEIATKMLEYNKNKNEVVKELEKRRLAEQKLFLTK